MTLLMFENLYMNMMGKGAQWLPMVTQISKHFARHVAFIEDGVRVEDSMPSPLKRPQSVVRYNPSLKS